MGQRAALIAVFGGVVAIGFSPIWVRLSDLGPNAVAFWRLALATPILWLWTYGGGHAVAQPKPYGPEGQEAGGRYDWLWLFLPGVLFTGDLIAWHQAIRLTSVANATFLPNMAPLLVSLIAWRWLGERLRPAFGLGLALALTGIGLMIGSSVGVGRSHVWGDLLGILTACFYAAYILAVKNLRRRYNASTIMLASAAVGTAILLVVTNLTGEPFLPGQLGGWLVLLGLAWFSHAGGQGLIAYALAHLPASFSSVSLLGQPVLAAIFAWLLLGETLTHLQMAGGAFVITGILLARRGSLPAPSPQPKSEPTRAG